MAKDKLTIASTDPVDMNTTETTEIPLSLQEADAVATPAAETDPIAANADSTSATPESATTKKETTEIKEPKAAKADKADNVPESDALDESATAKATPTDDDVAPPPPARPLLPLARIKKDLKDAFPQTDDRVIEAILIASEGRADPAFTALLFLLDPTFKPEPVAAAAPAEAPQPTVTDDELLARQLQKEFEKEDRRQHRRRRTQQQQQPPPPEEDSLDEFEQLKETFTQGFAEAKTTINGWVSGLSKKFAPEEQRPQSQRPLKLFGALGGSSFNNLATHNFDDDPEILPSDFRRKPDATEEKPPLLPTRTKRDQDTRWEPLNSDVPVDENAFLVTDLEDEDKK